MNPALRLISLALTGVVLVPMVGAAEPPAALSAKELAGKLSVLQQDGASYVRLKMDRVARPGAPKVTIQLQIKQRRTPTTTEVVYQILWPKDRAGEAVLLRQIGNEPASGSLFTPPGPARPLEAAQMREPLFGSDLSFGDVVENFFAWDQQKLVGTEMVDRVSCQILESKPGKSQQSEYAAVRTCVDARRLVPLRIEKYLPSGTLARRIDTTHVVIDDLGRPIPANLSIRGPQEGPSTELEGSRLRHGVTYTDHTFSAEGLSELAPPRSD